MSYGLRYTGSLIDHFGRTVTLNVYEIDYTGSSSSVVLAGVKKIINGSDSDLFVGKIGSSVVAGFLSESNFKYVDLYTANARKYKLEVEIDSVLDWSGWIIPENFTEPYDAPPYVTKVSARDGLSELQSLDFDLTGLQKQIDILEAAINKITGNVTSNLYVGVNIYEENHVTTESPLSQTYADCSRYEGLSWEDVVNDIINNYGARLYQKDGAFWFVCIPEFESELNIFKYTFVASPTNETYDPELLIGRPQDDQFANVDQQLNILTAWKNLTVKKDLITLESACENADFDDWTLSGTTETLDNWAESVSNIALKYEDKNKRSVYLDKNNTTPADGKFITQTLNNWVESNTVYNINIDYKFLNYVGSVQFWIKVEMWDGASTYKYLTDNGSWSSTESYINIETESKSNPSANYESINLPMLGTPIDGDMYVYIYASDFGNLVVDFFNFTQVIPRLYGRELSNDITYTIGSNTTPKEITLLTCDFPDRSALNPGWIISGLALNEQHVYKGGLFLDSNGEAITQRWQTKAVIDSSATPYSFAGHLDFILTGEKIRKIKTPQWAITGSILTQNIKSDSCIVDYNISVKKYLLCNGEYDMERCMFNGTFIEIGSYSGGDWILEDGTWNDDGIWKDDETWKDTI